MKRLAAIALLALPALVAGGPAAHAQAASQPREGRIVVITLDGTSLGDWLRADTFHLRRAVREGTPGLLSARTTLTPPDSEQECLARPAAARATLLNGARSGADDASDADPLRLALRAGGVTSRTIDAPLMRDSSFPTGRRTDVTRLAAEFRSTAERVILMDLPDALFADCAGGRQRDRWVTVALGRADATIGVVRASMSEGDRLIVLSSVPPASREERRNYLTAASLEDPFFDDAAILTSSTTRRRGVVSLTDVAGTIAALAGVNTRIGVGRAWTSAPGTLSDLSGIDAAYTHQSSIRLTVMRGYIWLAVALLIAAAIAVLAGRGRARGGRLPRTGRDWMALSLAAVVATPAAMLLEPLTGSRSQTASIVIIAGGAFAIATLAGVVRGMGAAPGIAAALAAWGLVAFVGEGELGARSVLSYSVAGGDRFFGVGNEMMGVAVASTLIGISHWLDRRPADAKWVPIAALLVAGSMAAPVAGAKFGSIFVAVPALGYFALRALGGRSSRESAIGIAIATVLVAGVVAAWDLLSSPDVQSHVARAVSDDATLGRKIGAALRLAAGSYWSAGLAASAGIAAILLRRRTMLLSRATWSRPMLRFALVACAIAGVTAIAFNDAGIVAAALIGIIGCAALLHLLLIGQAPPRSRPRA